MSAPDDDVTVAGRARLADAWRCLVEAAALALGYACVSPARDLWRPPHGGALQPLDVLVHEVRRALRRGGPKRRGFERAVAEAELAQVAAAGWAPGPSGGDPHAPQRWVDPASGALVGREVAAARCRAAALRDELAEGRAADGPVVVREGYDQRAPEGDDVAQVEAGGDLGIAETASGEGVSGHGGCVVEPTAGGE